MKKVFLKYIIYSVSLLVFSPVFSLPTFAQVAALKNPSSTPAITGAKKVIVDEKNTTDSEKIDNLKARALQEIDRRIKQFSVVKDKITTFSHLSEKNKTTLLTQVNKEITDLNESKSEITAETNLAALKKAVLAITTSYKVFAVLVPKIHIIAASEMIDTTADKIASISAPKEVSPEASSSAADETQKNLMDKLSLAHSNAASARTMAFSVSSVNLSISKVTLQKARTLLVVARQDLAEARQEVAKNIKNNSK